MSRSILAVALCAMACGRIPAKATVTIAVSGPGAVRSTNLQGDCRTTCWFSVDREVPVRLEPIVSDHAVFSGWTGACSGTDPCDLKPYWDVSVAAVFLPAVPHRVQVSLNGAGEVRSEPAGIDCPRNCAADFPEGMTVTLRASPSAGWDFIGYDGACAGGSCALAINADAAVLATFIQNAVELSVQSTGEGSVVSRPAAIDCPGVCSAKFAPGTAITLTASPAAGSQFDGFSGACAGTSCSLRLSARASVSAAFSRIPTFKVAVAMAGSGVGHVTSTPPAIDCPGTCTATIPSGTPLMLSAAPDALSRFSGFDGSCSGASCSMKVAADAAVIAKFDARKWGALDLGVPTGGSWTSASGLSPTAKLVIGTWGGAPSQMYLWDGALHDTGVATPFVSAINDTAAVVGAISTASGWHAFRWESGLITDLGTLGGSDSHALAINASGVAAGWSLRTDGVQRAVAWTQAGIVDLGSLVDGGCSYATGINSQGVIVGSSCTAAAGIRAARFRAAGAVDDLGSFGGTTMALAINDAGLIVGYSYLPDGTYHGFVYSDAKMIDAGALPPMTSSQLAAVNNAGIAVGYAIDTNARSHAVVYGSGRMVDLNTVVENTPFTLLSASGIDEAGNILVVGTTGSAQRALLLCPQ